MTESGIDYRITAACRKIRYLQVHKRCEISGKLVLEEGSELSRPHMHHYFFGPGTPWELRHNPAYFVCLCNEAHEVSVDAPHNDKPAFRRKYLLRLEKYNKPRWYVLKAAEGHLKRGEIPTRMPSKDEKKALLKQLKSELGRVEDESWMDEEACQVPINKF